MSCTAVHCQIVLHCIAVDYIECPVGVRTALVRETSASQYHVQVVVAGVVVTKAPSRTDLLTGFGLLVTDFGPVLLRPLQL